MAKFIVRDTFDIAGAGFGLIGQVTLGVVTNGNIVVLKKEQEAIVLRILSVEQVENVNDGDNWRALLLSDADKQKLEGINLIGKTIFVYEPKGAPVSEDSFWDFDWELPDGVFDNIADIFDGD